MGLSPDLMNENFDAITAWGDGDTGDAVSQINPAGQLELDTNNSAAGNTFARRFKSILSPPNKFTLEVRTYLDAIGVLADRLMIFYGTATWRFQVQFRSDGLYVSKTGGAVGEVGADIVKCNAGAAWQTWRFQVDKSAGEDAATVEVFLDGVSQGTVDCDYEIAGGDGIVNFYQRGDDTDDRISHIDYIRIATGLGEINDADIIQAGVL